MVQRSLSSVNRAAVLRSHNCSANRCLSYCDALLQRFWEWEKEEAIHVMLYGKFHLSNPGVMAAPEFELRASRLLGRPFIT
jgi:hypothetical protein